MTDDALLQREPDEAVIECIARALVPIGTNPDATYYVGGHISHRTAHPMWTKYLDTARRVAVAIASAPKAEASNRGHFEDHLSALRDANAGAAVTVWKDGSWQAWQTLDAKYAASDANWLCTIPFSDAIGDAFDIVRATAIAAVRREATSAERERCVKELRDPEFRKDLAPLLASPNAFLDAAADRLAANKPQGITPARDLVALLLAEAARLAKSDDLEDQRLARSYQDAAKMLEESD